MSSSFHVKILENSVSMMVDNARLLNEHIKKVVHQPDVNIRNYVDKFVLDILCGKILKLLIFNKRRWKKKNIGLNILINFLQK